MTDLLLFIIALPVIAVLAVAAIGLALYAIYALVALGWFPAIFIAILSKQFHYLPFIAIWAVVAIFIFYMEPSKC